MTLPRGIAPGEYYHVFGRGAHRQSVFREKSDWQRFLFAVLHLQSPHPFGHIGRLSWSLSDIGFRVPLATIEQVIATRFAELSAFCLMGNHFHLLVKEHGEGGIASYMQRVLDGYTKYFNTKYGGTGHLFQGRYKSVHVKDGRQLLYLSAYIHRNPREIKGWAGREAEYPWSSLQDYVTANRWGGLLATDIIASQFAATARSNYADFVHSSTSKILKEELDGLSLI